MNSQGSQNRWLVTAFAATALALIAAAPAGAWADAPGGRQDGKGVGSIPPPEIQSLHQRSATISSNLRHEGVQADRRLGRPGTSFGPMDTNLRTALVVQRATAQLAGLDPHIRNVVLDHRRSVSSGAGTVVSTMNPGVVVRDGKTFVPGVGLDGKSTLVEIHPRGVPVVPAVSATTDDGFEWSPAAIGLTAALAVALLMAVATVGVAGGRRRRVATL